MNGLVGREAGPFTFKVVRGLSRALDVGADVPRSISFKRNLPYVFAVALAVVSGCAAGCGGSGQAPTPAAPAPAAPAPAAPAQAGSPFSDEITLYSPNVSVTPNQGLPTPVPAASTVAIYPTSEVESDHNGLFTMLFGTTSQNQASCTVYQNSKALTRFPANPNVLFTVQSNPVQSSLPFQSSFQCVNLLTNAQIPVQGVGVVNLNSSVRIILRVQREASIAVFEGQAIIEFLKEYGTGPVLVGPQSEVLVNIEARTFRPLARARFTPEEEREFERLGQILLDGQSSIPPPAGIPHIELFISVEKPAYVRGVDKTAHFEVRVLDEEGNPVPDVVWGGEVGLEVTDQIGVYRGIIDISGEPSGAIGRRRTAAAG